MIEDLSQFLERLFMKKIKSVIHILFFIITIINFKNNQLISIVIDHNEEIKS